ncbi:protein NRT1/ PTR FAMILY 8.3-like [Nymphaea colorata]|nr:protein NRT1/ PTR FAMILY 8.3-like [Nymphaea colorata]
MGAEGAGGDHGGEERIPLLHKEASEEVAGDGSVDIRGRPALKNRTGNSRAAKVILVAELFESLAGSSISCNLTVYLTKVLRQGNASAAASINTWTGASYLTPILGALFADSYWGRYWTIFNFFFVYAMGLMILALSAFLSSLGPASCGGVECPSATNIQKTVSFFGLYLLAFGSGGISSSLVPFGADQFSDMDPKESLKKGSFFNWFSFTSNVGALISSTVLVWVQENVGWGVGYGISTGFIALAIATFVMGTPFYRLQRPEGSPLTKVWQVLVASFRKITLQTPADEKLLYEESKPGASHHHLSHTDDFRFLDKAAIVSDMDMEEGIYRNPWRLCTVTQVEELKLLLRLLPVMVTGIIYSGVYAQMFTVFVEQGSIMQRNVGSFIVPPATLYSFEVLTAILCIPIYDTIIVAVGRKFTGNPRGFTELQRMGIGRFLIILSMIAAALVEMKRLESNRTGRLMNIAWQLPQYFLIGVSEVFTCIGQMEFFYDQSPDSLKSVCTAMALLTISLGNYFSSLTVTFVNWATTRGGDAGWIPDDLNQGHLDYFFWVLAGVSALNLVVYIACAKKYKLKKLAHDPQVQSDVNK